MVASCALGMCLCLQSKRDKHRKRDKRKSKPHPLPDEVFSKPQAQRYVHSRLLESATYSRCTLAMILVEVCLQCQSQWPKLPARTRAQGHRLGLQKSHNRDSHHHRTWINTLVTEEVPCRVAVVPTRSCYGTYTLSLSIRFCHKRCSGADFFRLDRGRSYPRLRMCGGRSGEFPTAVEDVPIQSPLRPEIPPPAEGTRRR